MVKIVAKSVCIDTMILIYLLDGASDSADKAKKVFAKAGKVFCSILGHCETATGYYLKNDYSNLDTLTVLEKILDNFKYIPFDMEISLEAARLRAKYPRLKTPDSIHLATAITKGADLFVTDDKALKKISEIKVLEIKDVD